MSISGSDHPDQDSRVLGVLTGQVKIPTPPEADDTEDEEDETDG